MIIIIRYIFLRKIYSYGFINRWNVFDRVNTVSALIFQAKNCVSNVKMLQSQGK